MERLKGREKRLVRSREVNGQMTRLPAGPPHCTAHRQTVTEGRREQAGDRMPRDPTTAASRVDGLAGYWLLGREGLALPVRLGQTEDQTTLYREGGPS